MNTQGSSSHAGQLAGYFGLVAHGLLAVPLRALGLIAPMEAVYLLLAIWAVLLVFAVLLLRQRPPATPMIPLLMIAIAVGVMTIGGVLLDWTA